MASLSREITPNVVVEIGVVFGVVDRFGLLGDASRGGIYRAPQILGTDCTERLDWRRGKDEPDHKQAPATGSTFAI